LLQKLTAPVRNAEHIALSGLGMINPVTKVKGALICKVNIEQPVFIDERILRAFSTCAKVLDSEDFLEAHAMADRVLGPDPMNQAYC